MFETGGEGGGKGGGGVVQKLLWINSMKYE